MVVALSVGPYCALDCSLFSTKFVKLISHLTDLNLLGRPFHSPQSMYNAFVGACVILFLGAPLVIKVGLFIEMNKILEVFFVSFVVIGGRRVK